MHRPSTAAPRDRDSVTLLAATVSGVTMGLRPTDGHENHNRGPAGPTWRGRRSQQELKWHYYRLLG